MTVEIIRGLTDEELAKWIEVAQAERNARTEKRKQEAISKIKQLARSIDIGVKIEGTRGRQVGAQGR